MTWNRFRKCWDPVSDPQHFGLGLASLTCHGDCSFMHGEDQVGLTIMTFKKNNTNCICIINHSISLNFCTSLQSVHCSGGGFKLLFTFQYSFNYRKFFRSQMTKYEKRKELKCSSYDTYSILLVYTLFFRL